MSSEFDEINVFQFEILIIIINLELLVIKSSLPNLLKLKLMSSNEHYLKPLNHMYYLDKLT